MAKIMVVDDDPDLQYVLKKAFEEKAYKVVLAKNGKEALKKTKREKPDLILLDLMMPKLDGRSTALKLKSKQDTKKIPIVILTGYGDLKELFLSQEDMEGTTFLEKPTPLKKIIHVVRQCLGQR